MNSSGIDRIREAANLADVVGRYVDLRKRGSRYVGLCPFHKDKATPSLSVSSEKGLWICYGCRAAGNVFHFLQQIEGMTFPQALAQLSQETGIDVSEDERPQTAPRISSTTHMAAHDAVLFWAWARRRYADIHAEFLHFDKQACAYYADKDTDTAEARFWLTLGPTVQEIMDRKISAITDAPRRDLMAEYSALPKPIQLGIRRYRLSLEAGEKALTEMAGRE